MLNLTSDISDLEAAGNDLDLDLEDGNVSFTDNLAPGCQEPTEAQQEMYESFAWLFEEVMQSVVGIVGLLGNTIAIPILCSSEMSSIFNR